MEAGPTTFVATADEREGSSCREEDAPYSQRRSPRSPSPRRLHTSRTYERVELKLPDGQEAPLDGWRYDGVGTGANQCPDFGFTAGFPTTGVAATTTAGWWFEVPQDLTIAAYELYRAARVGVGSDGTRRAYALYHDVPDFNPMVHLFEFCLAALGTVLRTRQALPSGQADGAGEPRRPGRPRGPRVLILRMECRSTNRRNPCLRTGKSRRFAGDRSLPHQPSRLPASPSLTSRPGP